MLTAIVFDLIVLAVNSGISTAAIAEQTAAAHDPISTATYDVLLGVFIFMTVLLNIVALAALVLGRRNRRVLIGGLVAMYRDNDVDRYYDPSLMSNYGVRYLLFAGVIATLGLTATVVPLIIRLT